MLRLLSLLVLTGALVAPIGVERIVGGSLCEGKIGSGACASANCAVCKCVVCVYVCNCGGPVGSRTVLLCTKNANAKCCTACNGKNKCCTGQYGTWRQPCKIN